MVAQEVSWILLGLLLWPKPGSASLPLVMDSVIQALAHLEQKVPGTQANQSVPAWLLSTQNSGPHNPLHRLLLEIPSLEASELDPHALSAELQELVEKVARHGIRDGQEYGVVLAPDGSTVAVKPLLMGLTAGLQGRKVVALPSKSLVTLWGAESTLPDAGATLPNNKAVSPTSVDSLLGVTLAGDLGLSFLQGPKTQSQPGLGSEGCWDQLHAPQNFTLLNPKSSMPTTAFFNGALDGILLGNYLSHIPEPRPPLSRLLSQYYGAGVAADPEFRSNFRRQKGAALISAPSLAQQVWGALVLLQTLDQEQTQLRDMSQEQLAQVATYASKEFTEAFLGCPAIHPRCRWGAAPSRGSPTPLKLPLGFLYVHHTLVPAPPCTTFESCATSMRAMQRFHQDSRGWDDLGYSFVVGSEGYVYEGRGWQWVGAHTRGHNSRGFGVAIVGDYTETLPTEAALRTVRDVLPSCAVRAGLLRPDYKVLGHRQLVRTACPGDALFGSLHTWPRFSETGN